MSMKKFFIALSVLAALALSVVPSQALVGMPDDVPGCDILQGFFVVEVGDTGLDSLVIFQEVTGVGVTPTAANKFLHWVIRDKKSKHLKDANIPYTTNDVVAVSVRDVIANYLTTADKALLQTTLAGVDVYMGYFNWENSTDNNNFVAKMYLVNTAKGKAAGVNLAAKEFLTIPAVGNNYNWAATQYQAYTTDTSEGEFVALAASGSANLEGFSANALATSEQREAGWAVPFVAPDSFRLMPRFYLYDATAENFIFVWKSQNDANAFVNVVVYDTEENGVSSTLDIPYELNYIDVVEWLPPYFMASYPTAGWINIPLENYTAGWAGVDFLAYNWQLASSADAGVNWGALFQVAREVSYPGK